MNNILFFSMITLLFSFSAISGQDLSDHEWKNRIVLILADQPQNEALDRQLTLFKNEKNGMEERKLIVYSITPDQYKTGWQKKKWKKSEKLYSQYKKENAPFEVILLGLDGRVKLRQTEILPTQKLFSVIDAMPMRRNELRNKK